jgi:hypothetical protein
MKPSRILAAAAAVSFAVVAGVPTARADYVASPEEVRALRQRLAKSPPTAADYAAKPYPGAIFDAECSARHAAPRRMEGGVYCFYTRDPIEKVRNYLRKEGKPRNGAWATVANDVVTVDGQVKIDAVVMITYWADRKTMAYYERFPANPPPPSELIAPLYPGAAYDKECSAAKTLEAKRKPRWREVWCYSVNEPASNVRKAFDLDFRSTSKRGVQVDFTEVSQDPPVTQVEYWLTSAPPEIAAPTTQPAPHGAGVQPVSANPQAPSTASQTSAPPPAPAANPASQAADTINKMRGLFGR